MKRRLLTILFLLALLLTACGKEDPIVTEPTWPGYTGTMENYEYYHTEERDQKWEEDVLYIADKFLTLHPYLADRDRKTKYIVDFNGAYDVEYSDIHYNEALRSQFISEINQLIPEISSMRDGEIKYACSRIVAQIGCAHSVVAVGAEGFLPFVLEPIECEDGYAMCTVWAEESYADLLGSKFVSVNGIPVEEIVARLSEYIEHENEHWLLHYISTYDYFSFLCERLALTVVGVATPDDTSAEVGFEQNGEVRTVMVNYLLPEEFRDAEYVCHDMVGSDSMRFRHYDQNYWIEVVEDGAEPYVYARFLSTYEEKNYPINNFLQDIINALNSREEPMKLILDFRHNGGGSILSSAMATFIRSVNRTQTDGIYCLIDGGSFSAGVMIPYSLSKTVEDLVLVGSPTGQAVNHTATGMEFHTPNYGVYFAVSDSFIYTDPENTDDALYPDITVYQTLEDYQNHVDTVLEYVLMVDQLDD